MSASDSFSKGRFWAALGYGFAIGCSCIIAFSPGLFPPGAIAEGSLHELRLAFFLIMAGTALLTAPFSSFFSSRHGRTCLVVAAFALSPGITVSAFAGASGAWLACGWACSAVGSVAAMLLWGRLLITLRQRTQILVISGSFIVAGLAYALTMALPPLAVGVLLGVFQVLSSAFFLVSWRYADVSFALMRARSGHASNVRRAMLLSIMLTSACNLGNGFLASFASSSAAPAWGTLALAVASVAAGVVMAAVCMRVKRNVSYQFSRVLLPYLVVCAFFLGVLQPGGQVVAAACMFGMVCCVEVLSLANLAKDASYNMDGYTRSFSVNVALSRFAYGIGWFCCMLSLYRAADVRHAFTIACFALAAVLAVLLTLNMYQGVDRLVSIRHEDLGVRMASDSPGFGEANGEAAQASPDSDDSLTELDERIRALAQERYLTSRETEVFAYLARGRNSAYISKALFLSTNTVKSHMNRIYGKLEVHSQQELIDLVEQRR